MKALDNFFCFLAVCRKTVRQFFWLCPPDESLPPRTPLGLAVEMWPIGFLAKTFLCEPPKHKVKLIQHVWRLRCSFRVRGLWQALPREKL